MNFPLKRSMYDQILVPTDGSDTATEALRGAVEVAEQHNADLHLLHVIDEPPPTRNPGMLEKKKKKQEASAEQMLQEVLEEVETDGIRVHTAVRHGRPDEMISAYAENTGMDLILMGRQGRSGLNQWLLGSTTERVLRSCSVPVLVFPPVEQ